LFPVCPEAFNRFNMGLDTNCDGALNSSPALPATEAPVADKNSKALLFSLASLRWATVLIGLLLVAILLQWAGHSYSSEFSGADESAHFVTGLMIRDYVASGFRTSPMQFAEDYYAHYPKVAFGMWGPLLHVTEAAWMFAFRPSRISLLVLMALISATTAFLLSRALSQEFGGLLAIVTGLLFLSVSAVQHHTGMIMADTLVALMDFCAALAFGRYLQRPSWKYSMWFGAFVCLSVLTKANGVALLLLPGFAILFRRQWNILKQKSFWAAVAMIGCIAGPWQYYSAKALIDIAHRRPAGAFISGYSWTILTLFGIALLPIVAAGFYDRFILPAWRGSLDGMWASAAALVCSVWAFYCLVPGLGVDLRYLIAVMPPLLMFLVAGIYAIARWVEFLPMDPLRRLWATAAVVVVVFLIRNFSVSQKRYFGFDEVAERLESPEYKNSVILVSSDAQDGEGALISEIAMRERRPSHIILRATKMLSQSDWMGERYSLLYKTPDELMAFLESIPVEIVVIQDGDGQEYPEHKLLRQTIDQYSAFWEQVGTFPRRHNGEVGSSIDAYRLKSAAGRRVSNIRINLPYTLRHSINISSVPDGNALKKP
jgi:ABC-type cobalt transport system substrate-binding protein